MKKTLLLLVLALVTCAFAQQNPPEPSAASAKYDDARNAVTSPPFSLAKVNKIIKSIKTVDDTNASLKTSTYNSLTVKQKFTYCMLHAEVMSQNCNAMPPLVGEEHLIFAYPAPAFYDQASWSDRQRKFLHQHRGTVITLIRQTIKNRDQIGCNLKSAIVELNAVELIPDVVAFYKHNKKDQDALSLLMVLMKNGKYKPLQAVSWYGKLYGDKASYQATISASNKNIAIIERLAGAYAAHRG